MQRIRMLAKTDSPEAKREIHMLFKENRGLRDILHPDRRPPQITDPKLKEIEQKYDSLHGYTPAKCVNCGAPDKHIKINGIHICGKCRKPLNRKVASTPKPPQEKVTFTATGTGT